MVTQFKKKPCSQFKNYCLASFGRKEFRRLLIHPKLGLIPWTRASIHKI